MKFITLLFTLAFSQLVSAQCDVYVPDSVMGEEMIEAAAKINPSVKRTYLSSQAQIGVKEQEITESVINVFGEETIDLFVSYEIFKQGQLVEATELRHYFSDLTDIPEGVGASIADLCTNLVHTR